MRKSAKCAKKTKLPVVSRTVPKAAASEEKPLRPSQCRAHMRRVLAQEFPGIVAGFVKGAKSGSCQHVKLATELLEPKRRAPAKPRRGRSSMDRWAESLDRGV